MTLSILLILLILAAGFYMSWNIGANDVSNAMGTSVGSGALTLKRAVIIAAVLEFLGALLMGSEVSETLQNGIIDVSLFSTDPFSLLIGMFSALVATAVWLQVASYFGWPVSTTHAIVGAILGFGIVASGMKSIHWGQMGSIAASWIVSPLLSGVVSFIIFSAVQKKVLFASKPITATKRLIPYLVFIVILTFFGTSGYTGFKNLGIIVPLPIVLFFAFLIALSAALIAHYLCKKMLSEESHLSTLKDVHQLYSLGKVLKHLDRLKFSVSGEKREEVFSAIRSMEDLRQKMRIPRKKRAPSEYDQVEKMFSYLQILSACFVAFAHGANDVANAIGPVASALEIIKNPHNFSTTAHIPIWLLGLGGIGIVIGLATWGWRVIETIGRKITELTPTRGFCAEFGAAATILIASKLGLPISTTHCIVGAVFGVGLAKGISALNLSMIKDIILSWIITIPSSAVTAILLYLAIKSISSFLPLI